MMAHDAMAEFEAAIGDAPETEAKPAPDDNTEIARLAKLDPLAYDRERQPASEKLGVSVSALDVAVKAKRKTHGGDESGGRQRCEPRRAEPCSYRVEAASVLDEVAEAARRYLHLPRHGEVILALWAAHTYCFKAQPHTPRIAITSATRGCGKTAVLDFLSLTCQAPLSSDNSTTAAIFRLVEQYRASLLLDELDGRFREADDLRRILNSGWQRGGAAHRVEDIGGERRVVSYATHAPAALACIGRLPSTLEDRAIPLRMERAVPGELRARLRPDRPEEWEDLRSRLARMADDLRDEITVADPDMPGVHNRAADRWRILIAIADAAGGRWPSRARAAMEAETAAAQAADDGDAAVLLLADLRELFADGRDSAILSEIVETLTAREDRPWGEWRNGKPITTRGIGKLLGRFHIESRQIRTTGGRPRGYYREQLEPLWRRYLDTPSDQTVTPGQSPKTGASSDNQNRDTDDAVTVSDWPEPAENLACHGVTVSYGEKKEKGTL